MSSQHNRQSRSRQSRQQQSRQQQQQQQLDGGNAALTGAAVPAVLFVANQMYGRKGAFTRKGKSSSSRRFRRRHSSRRRR